MLNTTEWHTLESTEALQRLETSLEKGLSEAQASERLQRFGPNELTEQGGTSAWVILLHQFTSTMVLILIAAGVASALLEDYKDAAVIMAIVVLNALLGFHQEYRAEKAIAALKKYAAPTVKARREGKWKEISSRLLVPGDIVMLEAGNLVPADGRLIENHSLQVQEAMLTGESVPVDKKDERVKIDGEVPLGDRANMAFMGTTATHGRGIMAVAATGDTTELGRIATMIQSVGKETTPLQRKLNQLGRTLAVIVVLLAGLLFGLGLMRGEDAKVMFLTAVSLAVAAVPEGLPAVVTIALALGAQRMLKRNALLRNLPAVETLGSVTLICSDKTGTLTENRMEVTSLNLPEKSIDLNNGTDGSPDPNLFLLLAAAVLCNDSELQTEDGQPEKASAIGDPTEIALLHAGAHFGIHKEQLEKVLPRVHEVAFTSERKRMTTLHQKRAQNSNNNHPAFLHQTMERDGWEFAAFSKGAAETILPACTAIWTPEGQHQKMNDDLRKQYENKNSELARQGMRVLAVAAKFFADRMDDSKELEEGMLFLGLVAMADPPREEAREAVGDCLSAGIRPIMITGDHPMTAQNIAAQVGIPNEGRILTGRDVEHATPDQLQRRLQTTSVFARVSPEHKLSIVEVLQNQGHIVAMTGDGVNDAPALKKADIGVAMGLSGTDVAKEASDMILLDDNFASIVKAVREGRVIYDNIRKFIRYILSTNSAELWVMILAFFLDMPLALLPLQILWINLVTDGLPALALSIEPAEKDVMKRPPYLPTAGFFSRGLGWQILWAGLFMGLIAVSTGYVYWRMNDQSWQTMIFMTLTLIQMGNVMAIRSERDSLFHIGLMSNKTLLGAVILTVALQFAVVYVPFLQSIFSTQALSLRDIGIVLAATLLVFAAIETEKWVRRRRKIAPPPAAPTKPMEG